MPGLSLKEQFPFRLTIAGRDATGLLADSWSFASKDPGGFESASFSVPVDVPDVRRGDHVLLTSGLATAWEGRVSQVQRSLGNRTSIVCEGYSSLLADSTASMVFVDRDLSRWGQPSSGQQLAMVTANQQLGSSVAGDGGAAPFGDPALVQTITDSWASPNIPICAAWYDAGPGNLIAGAFLYLRAQAAGGTWNNTAVFSSDDINTVAYSTENLNSGSAYDAYRLSPAPVRYMTLNFWNSATPAGTQGASYQARWLDPAVYGNHGLTGRGADPQGFYPSDVAAWVVGQVPGLQVGVTQLTDETGFILPHSAYYTPVTLDTMMADMAKVAGWHWGVWESQASLTGDPRPRVDFRPRPALGQFSAFCLRRDTAVCDVREDLSQQFNQCVVAFTDSAGVAGVATVTMTNPILDEAGIESRTLPLSVGTMDAANAALYGQEALAFTYQTARVSGSIQIDQAIDLGGGPGPAWLLKPGIDRLRVGDLPSTDAWGTYSDLPLNRMEFSGSSAGFSVSLEVGLGASLVETLQARIGAAGFLAGQGG